MMIRPIDPNWIIKKGPGVIRFLPSCSGRMLGDGAANTNPQMADVG